MKEHFTNYERIVGGSEEDKSQLRDKLENLASVTEYEELKPYLIEPSTELKDKTAQISQEVDNLIESFGVESKEFPSNKIYYLKKDSVKKLSKGDIATAQYSSLHEVILVDAEKPTIQIELSVAHELLHAKSLKVHGVKSKGQSFPFRQGIALRSTDGKEVYFDTIEEAIVTHMTRMYANRYLSNRPEYQENMSATQKVRDWTLNFFAKHKTLSKRTQLLIEGLYYIPDADYILEVLESEKEDSYKLGFISGRLDRLAKDNLLDTPSRIDELLHFDKIVEEIFQKSNGKYQSKEDVISDFVKANYSGKLLSLARKVENILGKGSFRKIGQEPDRE